MPSVSSAGRQRREREGERVRRDLAHTVVGRVRDPDAAPGARRRVDGVVSGPDAAHHTEPRQRVHDRRPDRRVLQQDGAAVAPRRDHLRLGLALPQHQLEARIPEQGALEVDVREIEVGEENLGHRESGEARALNLNRGCRAGQA
jgi:hypothetical protein